MLFYFLVLIVAVILANQSESLTWYQSEESYNYKTNFNYWLVILCLFMALVAGFRTSGTGTDTYTYLSFLNIIRLLL